MPGKVLKESGETGYKLVYYLNIHAGNELGKSGYEKLEKERGTHG